MVAGRRHSIAAVRLSSDEPFNTIPVPVTTCDAISGQSGARSGTISPPWIFPARKSSCPFAAPQKTGRRSDMRGKRHGQFSCNTFDHCADRSGARLRRNCICSRWYCQGHLPGCTAAVRRCCRGRNNADGLTVAPQPFRFARAAVRRSDAEVADIDRSERDDDRGKAKTKHITDVVSGHALPSLIFRQSDFDPGVSGCTATTDAIPSCMKGSTARPSFPERSRRRPARDLTTRQ